MLRVVLYGGVIKRQRIGIVHGSAFHLSGEGFYHRIISGRRIIPGLPA